MAHKTACVAGVKDPTKGLGNIISRVDNVRDMAKFNVALAAPILYSKVLDVDVPRTFGWFHRVDHPDGGDIVFIKNGW